MNHRINSLTFGDISQHDPIVANFGHADNGTHTIFNMFKKDGKVNEELKFKVEDEPQDYFYFIKLVPHVFVDTIGKTEMTSYSYSLNHNKKTADI